MSDTETAIKWHTYKHLIRGSGGGGYKWHEYHNYESIQAVIEYYSKCLNLSEGEIVEMKDRDGKIHKFKLVKRERKEFYMEGIVINE